MIHIVDYGAGNLRSVQNTLNALGATYTVTPNPAAVAQATKIILPGVGHFGQMMRALDERGLRPVLLERIQAGVPFLGICLGMQAMFEASDEAPEEKGFALFPGRVQRFPSHLRVPHMGWNEIEPRADARLTAGLGPAPYVFFANSYYCPPGPYTAARCTYELPFSAALEQDNVFGVQFHPEKSGALGLKIVGNFVEL
jgi:imidazole glycerol phosphate synthase glutamine amidotransferase subunit